MTALGDWLDRLEDVAPQRWLLGAASVAAAALASLAAGWSGGGQAPMVTVVVVGLAVGAALYPAGHAGLGVVLVVVWQWLATSDDTLSPLAVVLAVALFGFHVLTAMPASTPVGATLDAAIARRWARRTAVAAASSAAMWGAVVLMGQRRAAGSVLLTFAGFVVAAALVVALRWWLTPGTTGTRRQP